MKKMYSDMNNSDVQRLMGLIEARDLETVLGWVHACSEKYILPACGEENSALVKEMICLLDHPDLSKQGKEKIKAVIREVRTAAAKEKNPAVQAALRAVSTGAAVITTPSSALGFVLYGVMAYAYSVCDPAAETAVIRKAEEALKDFADLLEKTPQAEEGRALRVKWNC